MTSTAHLPIRSVPTVPSLSLVPAPRLADPERPAVPAADPSAPAANRPRFRRLVVFTGQLS